MALVLETKLITLQERLQSDCSAVSNAAAGNFAKLFANLSAFMHRIRTFIHRCLHQLVQQLLTGEPPSSADLTGFGDHQHATRYYAQFQYVD
jgi:hypothetical protein